jgi:hypothetical protein
MQASMLMALNSLYGNITWKEINKLTDYDDNLYSWSTVAADVLNDMIPGTLLISNSLNYEKFAEKGEGYLKRALSPQSWYELQKAHASPNFLKEQQSAKRLIKKGLSRYQSVTTEDIINYLKHYLVIALVDPHIIKNTPGYSGHFVVIYDSIENNFYIHDPGLPPQPEWIVNHNLFMKGYKGDLIIVPKNPKEISLNSTY